MFHMTSVKAFNQVGQCEREVIDTINKTTSLWMAVNLSPQVSQPRGALHSDLKKKDPRELQEITEHSLLSGRKYGIICRSFRPQGLQEVVAVTFVLAGLCGLGRSCDCPSCQR